MSPVTFEDHLLLYLERENECSSELQVPPPAACNGEVQGAYAFLKYHPLTGLLGFFFLAIIVGMIFSTLFPSEHH